MLENYIGDYFEDVSSLNIKDLIQGIKNVKLKKDYFNNLLGVGIFQLESSNISSIQLYLFN